MKMAHSSSRSVSSPASSPAHIESVLQEKRLFKPVKDFGKQAHIKSFRAYQKIYKESVRNPEKFWGAMAEAELEWFKKWKKVLVWKYPFVQWFVGGKINIVHNCLDRHLETWRKNKAAILWEGEPGETRTLTYHELPGLVHKRLLIESTTRKQKLLSQRMADTDVGWKSV